jgi:hypothetical protein
MPVKNISDRPPKVALAVKLYYFVVGMGILRVMITIFRHAEVRSPYFLISMKVLIYLGSLYLIYQLGKGKNWARISLVVIFMICIPLVILPFFASLSHNPADSVLGILQTILYIIGLALVFHKNSSHWFGSEKIQS